MPSPDSLRWSSLSVADVQAWADLTNLLAVTDSTDEFYEPGHLAEQLAESGVDPARDTVAVWDGERLVAFGQFRLADQPDASGRFRCWLGGGVHPDYRRRGIGTRLLGDLEQRSYERLTEKHGPVPYFWRIFGGLAGSPLSQYLLTRGYEVARYFQDLSRPLTSDEVPLTSDEVPLTSDEVPLTSDEVPVPSGTDVRLLSPSLADEERVRIAHNAAFVDHWGAVEFSPARWHDQWISSAHRLEVATIAVNRHGQVLSYVLAGQWTPRELYVTFVGTIPTARGRGLAAACLARTVALAQRSGTYDLIELSVDSDSPTGATRLYQRAGFVPTKLFVTMSKDGTRESR